MTTEQIRRIDVQGLNRVDKTNVRAKIYSQVGQGVDRARISEDVKRIYRMAADPSLLSGSPWPAQSDLDRLDLDLHFKHHLRRQLL